MIKLLLSLIIIILVLVYFWKYVLLTEPKKVKFHKKVNYIIEKVILDLNQHENYNIVEYTQNINYDDWLSDTSNSIDFNL